MESCPPKIKFKKKSPCNKKEKNLEFIMFKINQLSGYDMNGIYWIQKTGNEQQLEKFKQIIYESKDQPDEENPRDRFPKFCDSIKFYETVYTEDELNYLKKFKEIWNLGENDVVQRQILRGKLKIPEKNINENIEEWWENNIGYIKYPEFENIIENVEEIV